MILLQMSENDVYLFSSIFCESLQLHCNILLANPSSHVTWKSPLQRRSCTVNSQYKSENEQKIVFWWCLAD